MSDILTEQETILRWDRDERILHLYTSYQGTADQWRRLGYAVRELSRRSWAADVPLDCFKGLRPLVDGRAKKRAAPRTAFRSRLQSGDTEASVVGRGEGAGGGPDGS